MTVYRHMRLLLPKTLKISSSTMGSPTAEGPASSTLQPTSWQEVRNKFYTVIGINSPKAAAVAAAAASEHTVPPQRRQSVAKEWMQPQDNTCRLEETLKFDRSYELDLPKRKKIETESDEKRPKKRISFDTKVKVVPIPMRDEYCLRVRTRLWSNAMEIHENATRNSIEFASEG